MKLVVSATMALLAQFVSALQNASMEDAWNAELVSFDLMVLVVFTAVQFLKRCASFIWSVIEEIYLLSLVTYVGMTSGEGARIEVFCVRI